MGVQWSLHNAASYPPGQIKSLAHRAITGNYKSHGEISAASCVIIPSFGYRREGGRITPGLCNLALAQIAMHTFPGIPKFVSHEVDDAFRSLGTGTANVYRFGEPGYYYETRAVARDTVKLIFALGLLQDGDPVVLAHQNHMPRADATIQAMLPARNSTIVPAGLEIPWDPLSEQYRARCAASWAPYELLAIGRAAALGWLDMNQAV